MQHLGFGNWTRRKIWRIFVALVTIVACIIASIVTPRLLSFNAMTSGPAPTGNSGLTQRAIISSTSVSSKSVNALQISPHQLPSGNTSKPAQTGKNQAGTAAQPTATTGGSTAGTASAGNTATADPSGQAIPNGDLAGWRQIFAEDFNTNVPAGSFPGSIYGNEFTTYADGTPDTAGQQGAPSRYYPSKVASVSNGLLDLYLHTENGTPMAAAFLPKLQGNHLYGKYTIRFRADNLPGFKTAWLLWPDDNIWPSHGEIDFPENGLDGTINAFMHHLGASSGNDQDTYTTSANDQSWHTTSIEWTPNSVNFILDGQSIGTSTTRIPNGPMHWVIQTESCLPTCPAASTAGYIQIDWITAYTPA
ncbi:glycoside hydrolase family 16 protein [Dictyobacter arantiisoli]|uniref:GH16 domain-containing protein n=1 Tax=Dictyobacter arantiisoli TaxID=2014874 RepID=A0A5A5TG37_9CHLR|nr:glycoside hydrolase family 16 protein [Dictyobacter arantiisoli]GCF10033.1 hypothetical protein KDI_35970 [Dictyobacter arantiisoli]